MAVVIAIVVGVVAATLLFPIFFRDRDDFTECLKYSLTPDIVSLFRRRLLEDWFHSYRLSFYLFASSACGIGAYYLVSSLFH